VVGRQGGDDCFQVQFGEPSLDCILVFEACMDDRGKDLVLGDAGRGVQAADGLVEAAGRTGIKARQSPGRSAHETRLAVVAGFRLQRERQQARDVGDPRVADEIADAAMQVQPELAGECFFVERQAIRADPHPQERP
jgi:hypothetical protein